MKPLDYLIGLLILSLALVPCDGCVLPTLNAKATAAVYVYEKDTTAIPGPVSFALNVLNKRGIVATHFEADTVDGTGETPTQYVVPLAAAKTAGLPALVVTAADKVLRVVKDPKTEASVLEAVQ